MALRTLARPRDLLFRCLQAPFFEWNRNEVKSELVRDFICHQTSEKIYERKEAAGRGGRGEGDSGGWGGGGGRERPTSCHVLRTSGIDVKEDGDGHYMVRPADASGVTRSWDAGTFSPESTKTRFQAVS